MKKTILSIICFFITLSSPVIASESDDLLQLFHLAVENGDLNLIQEVIEALLKSENSSKHLLDALAKYSEKGKIDFALHNAIMDKNLLASVVLVYHAQNLNTRKNGNEAVWISLNSQIPRPMKSPLELSLQYNMIEIIPYLLMKKADPYPINDVSFLYEEEENPDYLQELDYKVEKKVCVKTGKPFFRFPYNINFIYKRNFIGDAIAKNRLDVIEILQKFGYVDWNKICCRKQYVDYTPLQFALAIKRYEIAQFLIDHGARIE